MIAAIATLALSAATQSVPDPLPVPMANNSVASAKVDGEIRIFSLLGLVAGTTWQHVSNTGYVWMDGRWQEIVVPGAPRLASVAVTVAEDVFVIGGYTVAEDGSEKSVPDVYRLDPRTLAFTSVEPMPVPVDDAVAAVYQDRYIYLVSGWHDDGNVPNVQVYDTQEDSWRQATPFPGDPVFGHAGGMIDDALVICGGARVQPLPEGKRTFVPAQACYVGTVNTEDPLSIDWQAIEHHPGPPLYRAAAAGVRDLGMVVFAGGTDNPYNYDGMGYDGVPAQPRATVFGLNTQTMEWSALDSLPTASMDHRGLVEAGEEILIIGGLMGAEQVSPRVQSLQ